MSLLKVWQSTGADGWRWIRFVTCFAVICWPATFHFKKQNISEPTALLRSVRFAVHGTKSWLSFCNGQRYWNYTGLFISPSGISDPCGKVAGMVTPKGSMSTEGETLQVSVLPYRCSICWLLRAPDKRSSHTLDSLGRWPRPASSFRSAQAATLLEFQVPLTNCFVRRWFCAVHGPKPPLHHHNWLSFGKFQDTERFLIPVHGIFRHDYPLAVEPASTPRPLVQKKNFERFSTYWYALLPCLSWLLRSRVRKFRRDLWITL